MRRRKTKLSERLKPCECCGYPVTERHHATPIATHGENIDYAYLCANCHVAAHVFERAIVDLNANKNGTPNVSLMATIRDYWGEDSHQFRYLCDIAHYTHDIPAREARVDALLRKPGGIFEAFFGGFGRGSSDE